MNLIYNFYIYDYRYKEMIFKDLVRRRLLNYTE